MGEGWFFQDCFLNGTYAIKNGRIAFSSKVDGMSLVSTLGTWAPTSTKGKHSDSQMSFTSKENGWYLGTWKSSKGQGTIQIFGYAPNHEDACTKIIGFYGFGNELANKPIKGGLPGSHAPALPGSPAPGKKGPKGTPAPTPKPTDPDNKPVPVPKAPVEPPKPSKTPAPTAKSTPSPTKKVTIKSEPKPSPKPSYTGIPTCGGPNGRGSISKGAGRKSGGRITASSSTKLVKRCSGLSKEPKLISWKNIKTVRTSKPGHLQKNSAKNGGSAAWNAGAISDSSISNLALTGVAFQAGQNNKNLMVGLSSGDNNFSYTDIDYAIYLTSGGTVYIYEKGSSKGAFMKYQSGDSFSVEFISGQIQYSINGYPFYVSGQTPAVGAPLLVDTSFHTPGGFVYNAQWICNPDPVQDLSDNKKVQFVNMDGVYAINGVLEKARPTNKWDSGAASLVSFSGKSTVSGVSFKAGSHNKNMMVGLSNCDNKPSYQDIDFAIYLTSGGTVYIYEKGSSKGAFEKYNSDDIFAVEVRDGAVVYIQNGLSFYTSKTKPSFPLALDSSFHSKGGSVYDVKFVSTPKDRLASKGDKMVYFEDNRGVKWNKGSVTKVRPTNAWDSGATSQRSMESRDVISGVSFQAAQANKNVMVGLAYGNSHESYTDIDYAIYQTSGGTTYIYEAGSSKGAFMKFRAGDVFTVEYQNKQIVYTHNGKPFYTSNVLPQFPLSVDTSFHSKGGSVNKVKWVSNASPKQTMKPGQPIVFKSMDGVSVDTPNKRITKVRPTSKWDSGVSSVASFKSGDKVQGISFRPVSANKNIMIGLNNDDVNESYQDLDYAIYLTSGGTVYIYERGSSKGSFQKYNTNSVLSIEWNNQQIQYLQDGKPFYTSKTLPEFPLYMDSSFHSKSGAVRDLEWIAASKKLNAPSKVIKPGQPVFFESARSVTATPGTLAKIGNADKWDAGAVSQRAFASDDDVKGVSFVANAANKNLMVGLAKGDSNESYQDIDFAVYLTSGGTIYIYESGSSKGAFAKYHSGDSFGVVYRNGQIVYTHNGDAFYTSQSRPNFPSASTLRSTPRPPLSATSSGSPTTRRPSLTASPPKLPNHPCSRTWTASRGTQRPTRSPRRAPPQGGTAVRRLCRNSRPTPRSTVSSSVPCRTGSPPWLACRRATGLRRTPTSTSRCTLPPAARCTSTRAARARARSPPTPLVTCSLSSTSRTRTARRAPLCTSRTVTPSTPRRTSPTSPSTSTPLSTPSSPASASSSGSRKLFHIDYI
eukprot:JP445938.1.p1 GENE.JP445938.1~~JP445938.1.p1  ORF type:complete len:1301 (-),score=458.74 JP445938.1:18-3791(-)